MSKQAVKRVLSPFRDKTVPPPNPATDFPAAWAIQRGEPFSEWNGLRFEIVSSLDGLLKLADDWRELTRNLNPARHIHHVEWFLALTRTLDENGDRSYFYVAIFDGSKLAGVVPLRVHLTWPRGAWFPVKALRLLSNIRETPSIRDIIAAPSIIDADIFTGLMRYLDQMNGWWDVLALTDVIEGSHAHAAFAKASSLASLTTPSQSTEGYIDSILCGPNDKPFERVSRKFKVNLRRAHSKFDSLDARFVIATTPEELRDALPQLAAVEAAGWKSDSRYCIANHPGFESFLQHLMTYTESSGMCEIHLLQVSGRAVAGMFCVVSSQISFMHVIGHNGEYPDLSPGHLLIENLINVQGGSAGKVTVATGGHAAPWFTDSWKPEQTLAISDHYLFRPSKRGDQLHKQLTKLANGAEPEAKRS